MKRLLSPVPDDDLLEDGLPPMAEDEEAGGEDGELEDIVDDQRDDGMSWLDDNVGIDDYDDATIAKEIGATDGTVEPTWTDGSEADDALEGTESDIGGGEEYGWTEENDAADSEGWDDGLGVVDEDAPSVLDDAGEEGVDDEHMEIDVTSWRTLDDAEGEGADDEDEVVEIEQALTFEQEMRAGGELLPPLLEKARVKAAWLGPPDAAAVAVAFLPGGALCAAGAGLFAAAGGALVAAGATHVVEEAQATSVAVDPEQPATIFVGSLLGGVLVSRDAGATVEPRNGWTATVRGGGTPGAPGAPVRLALGHGSTLWVLTGRGHLLRSEDAGTSYRLVLPEARVVGFACDAEGPAFAALAVDAEGLAVHWCRDGDAFVRRALPPAAAPLARAPEPRLAVRGEAVLVGDEDLEVGLLYSGSSAAPWTIIEDCPRATAVALSGDPAAPTLLAGLFFAGLDLGTLVRRAPGGAWVRVCDVGGLERLFPIEKTGVEDISTRIHDIAVNPLDHQQVALATGYGVFLVEMKDV
jgi:hypothetical protein